MERSSGWGRDLLLFIREQCRRMGWSLGWDYGSARVFLIGDRYG
jgi:hypothetical protein